MTTDYKGNSDKAKKASEALGQPDDPDKKVEKVVKGEVVHKKRSIGRKMKDTFVAADFGSVMRYVVSDVLLPAARNMIVESTSKGIERMMYGDSRSGRSRGTSYGSGPKFSYNNPIHRGPPPGPRGRDYGPTARTSRDDIIISSREDADTVLERLIDIVDAYGVASVADLNDLVGFPTSHVDNKWGWSHLGHAHVRQIREGWLIDLPPAEPLN